MKKIFWITAALLVSMHAADTAVEKELELLKEQIRQLQNAQQNQQSQTDALLDEVLSGKESKADAALGRGVSSLGLAASKVYGVDEGVSIGGYAEYEYKKYNGFKNYSLDTANATRNLSEFNIVRFIPYFGYKFNDWILMNTEIEFEDGGARSDNTLNYKYAVVEFSYLDFIFDPAFALRIGHVLVPVGSTNLNHEPIAFLTTERPMVETLIIPSTWHTNGALFYGKIENFEYYAGVVTSPNAGAFQEGRFIQLGRLGARQFTEDFSGVVRAVYHFGEGWEAGAAVLAGKSSVLQESAPGATLANTQADITLAMFEAHLLYAANGIDLKMMGVSGRLDGQTDLLPGTDAAATPATVIPQSVYGAYITVGYDLFANSSIRHKLFVVAEVEHLNMDAMNETVNSDNYRYYEYSAGLAYFPDPKVVIKADYWIRDYASQATLADEAAVTVSLGYIF